MDISLGNLRPLRIQVLGEVAQPGAYVISPSSTLFTSLYYFNGPTIFGSLRDIVLIRKGEKIASIDFYDYLLTGKKPEDQKLQHDDVIFIPQRLKTISIQGAVKRPGIYELKNDETLSDLFEIGGGLKNTAYLDRAQIDRIVPFEERKNLDMDRMIIDINLSDFLKTKEKLFLYDGDDIEIFSIKDLRQNTVRLIGAVNRSGNYDIKDSLSLVELISKADGVVGDAYLKRVDITRTEQDLTETLIKIDLDKALRGELEHNIMLQSLDVVRVYSITEMVEKDYVTIVGQVNNPGNYTLQKNMSLYDLIFKAGGIIDEKNKKLMYMDRADLVRWSANSSEKELIVFNLDSVLNKNGKAQLMLKPDDLVRIYSKKEIEGETSNVNISGMVKRPGDYELFKHNMTVYDLLFKAGGLDDPEFSAKIFFDRADLIRLDEDRITSSIKPFNLKNAWGKKADGSNFKLLPGDKIRVYSKDVFNVAQSVTIKGAVNDPGIYELKNNMTIKDLILEAGGTSRDVFKYKIELARINPENMDDNIYSEIIELEMDNNYSIEGNNYYQHVRENEFLLKPYDLIAIRPDPFFNIQKTVVVEGEVYYPGEYSILGPNEKLSDIISRSGGLSPGAFLDGSLFVRDNKILKIDLKKILKNPKSSLNISMQNGDSILIARQPFMIEVRGEVNVPGFYKFSRGLIVKDVLLIAGGRTINADDSNIFISYANGHSRGYGGFLRNPRVFDGSIVTIGKKKEEEPFDSTKYFTEVTTIIANLAQALSLVILARMN